MNLDQPGDRSVVVEEGLDEVVPDALHGHQHTNDELVGYDQGQVDAVRSLRLTQDTRVFLLVLACSLCRAEILDDHKNLFG